MRAVLATLGWLLLSSGAAFAEPEAQFRQGVAGVLERRCVRCHQPSRTEGGLDLTRAETALLGGESGPAIVPGRPGESLLLEQVSGDPPAMPKAGAPLPSAEVELVRQWIADGAAWPADLVLGDRRWWSLAPLELVDVPDLDDAWVATPIDAFVLQAMRSKGLSPSPQADRRTLVRRLYFDLHGLPPTPEQIACFVNDSRPDAYPALVDALLASPRYGERWGRHWLDVVHFGESHGYDKDKPRLNAWPYRDYVIGSLNADRPYDRFVAEQVSGDVMSPDSFEALAATGFVAAGPWDFVGHVELREGTVDKDIARSNDRDDMVAGVMSAFLSLTVHCARCHDHKFDPIPQADYYAIQAVFAGIDRADRHFEPDRQVGELRRELDQQRRQLEQSIAELAKSPPAEGADGSPNSASMAEELAAVKIRLAGLPPSQVVYCATREFEPIGAFRPAAEPRPIHLLARGDVRNPQRLVAPAGLGCIEGLPSNLEIEDARVEGARRRALARWLVDPRNGLLRRSIVNRVWQYHFGQGIVDTPNDFGRMGSLPTHPELLDWLAGWFSEHGHSLKQLHRLMVTSSVYRQVSRSSAEYERLDAGNQYLWRASRRRLDAESTRDSLLAVAGRLDLSMGGPSAQQFAFKDDHSPVYDYARFDVDDPRGLRRSVYRFIVRSVPDPFMESLDCPDASVLTPKRNTTLTAIQALALLNNPLTVQSAVHFAQRLSRTAPDTAGRIIAAYELALGRSPSQRELAVLADYADRHSLAAACRVLLNCNEFVFVD